VTSAQRDPLRILQVILSRGFAGSERAVAETCNMLCPRHRVRLLVRRDHRDRHGASVRDHLDDAVEVAELPPRWRTGAAVREEIRSWRPDVVHTHLRRGTRLVAKATTGTPHLCTLHIGLNGPHFLQADGIACISDWQVEQIPRAYHGLRCVIPNSLVPEPWLGEEQRRALRAEFGAGDGDLLVGGVGRLVPGKGFDTLVRAFERAAIPGARLVIVGQGRELRKLRRLAGEGVHFAGFRHDAKRCFQAFDVFVCPSRREPFGRVIVEALDAGNVVLATDAAGPRDIARRFALQLFPPGDVDGLVHLLLRLPRRPARVRPDLSVFHPDAVGRALEDAYRSVLAAGHGSPAGRAVERCA
jgi:glycosyltransferase involved in cell wall biosynthesis